MKDIKIVKVIAYIDMLVKQRTGYDKRTGWLDSVRCCEQIQNILLLCWLSGGIDRKEYDSLAKKYKVRSKDIRRYIYTADVLDSDILK